MRIKWENIVGIIIVVIVLTNLKALFNFIKSMSCWFASSLNGLNHFSPGAQTAIAFTLTILVLIMVFKLIQK